MQGKNYRNNSAVHILRSESNFRFLICLTDLLECCSINASPTPLGTWTLPNGLIASTPDSVVTLSRGPSSVSLSSKKVDIPRGIYTCEIPDASGERKALHIYISQTGGALGNHYITLYIL